MQRLFRGKLMSVENWWDQMRRNALTTTPSSTNSRGSFSRILLAARTTTRTSSPSFPSTATCQLSESFSVVTPDFHFGTSEH